MLANALPDIYQGIRNTVLWVGRRYLILGVNQAYWDFARLHGAGPQVKVWGPGRSVLECVPEVLLPTYRGFYDDALAGRLVEHEYLCHSPERHRRFLMRLVPRGDGTVISEHSLVIDEPHEVERDVDWASAGWEYRQASGLISKCCSCHRVRHGTVANRWDLVRSLIGPGAPDVTHGLCPVCAELLYPGLSAHD